MAASFFETRASLDSSYSATSWHLMQKERRHRSQPFHVDLLIAPEATAVLTGGKAVQCCCHITELRKALVQTPDGKVKLQREFSVVEHIEGSPDGDVLANPQSAGQLLSSAFTPIQLSSRFLIGQLPVRISIVWRRPDAFSLQYGADTAGFSQITPTEAGGAKNGEGICLHR